MTQVAYIVVKTTCHANILNDEDQDVAGVYRLEIRDGVKKEWLANAALDGFHTSVPVNMLDDFKFTVLDESLKNALVCDADIEDYELKNEVVEVDRVDDVFQIWVDLQLQKLVNDQVEDHNSMMCVDATTEFFSYVDQVGLEGVRKIENRSDSSNALIDPKSFWHDGPYFVDAVAGICEAFDIEGLDEITPTMLNDARDRAFV